MKISINQSAKRIYFAVVAVLIAVAAAIGIGGYLKPASADEVDDIPHYTSTDFVAHKGSFLYDKTESGQPASISVTVDYALYIWNNHVTLGYTNYNTPSGYECLNSSNEGEHIKAYVYDVDTGEHLKTIGVSFEDITTDLAPFISSGQRVGFKIVGTGSSIKYNYLTYFQSVTVYCTLPAPVEYDFYFTYIPNSYPNIVNDDNQTVTIPIVYSFSTSTSSIINTLDFTVALTDDSVSAFLNKSLPMEYGNYTEWMAYESSSGLGDNDVKVDISKLGYGLLGSKQISSDGTPAYLSDITTDLEHGDTYLLSFSTVVYRVVFSAPSYNAHTVSAITSLLPKFEFSYYDSDRIVELPESPIKDGYSFDGWYYDAACTSPYILYTPIVEDTVLYAKYTPKVATLIYELNGGAWENPEDEITSFTIEDTVVLATPIRNGYTFGGWYSTSDFAAHSKCEVIEGEYSDTPYKFYARWTPTTYTITYELYDGTLAAPTTSYTILTNTLTLATPAKDGYSFMGWYNNSGFTGIVVTEIPKGSTGNKSFYARWQRDLYSIMLELNGGALVEELHSLQFSIESDTIALPAAEREGYVFGGWYNNSALAGSPVVAVVSGSFGDKTFFAKWEIKTYKVTFKLPDGVVLDIIEVQHGTGLASSTIGKAMLKAFGLVYVDEQLTQTFDGLIMEDTTLYGVISSAFMANWIVVGTWLESYWWTLLAGAGALAAVIIGLAMFAKKQR